ncbi:hypothetical protein AG1IA_01853 [Rhizoctonia solani AG-1 IA]|uniref:Uncharacterized protein n=1 Tax=Thanatephorus cucumeris (strain AG1-IA) TaxID=983506 RepID=L8X4S6_THACA|nr:hypothetical protein AG1IA_01853 [Rhizoctonia solani AG-1 IA]
MPCGAPRKPCLMANSTRVRGSIKVIISARVWQHLVRNVSQFGQILNCEVGIIGIMVMN